MGKQYIVDDLGELLKVIPPELRDKLERMEQLSELLEVVLDLGRQPEARFPNSYIYLSEEPVTKEQINYVVSRIGDFGPDHRAGITRTLHRISSLVNRRGEIIGLTLRVGRAVYGTVDIIRDVIETGKSILLMGKPGVGKTTMLREVARVLADDLNKRVIVVDTSNEIAGDGDIPHPAIGRARRMQVPTPELQHEVMIEAVENHMPEVIIIDEIGRELEVMAARTIAERGVQLVATAHGNTLENLIQNPTLCDLVGGIQAVTLSDEEARYRGTQKTVLERRAPPTFEVLVEIKDRETLVIHHDVAETVDKLLRDIPPQPEIRTRSGKKAVAEQKPSEEPKMEVEAPVQRPIKPERINIFPYGVSRDRLERAIHDMNLSATITRNLSEAHAVVTIKSQEKRKPQLLIQAETQKVPVYVLRNNTSSQIRTFLRKVYGLPEREWDSRVMEKTEEMIFKVLKTHQPVELPPEPPPIRRLQHEMVEKYGLYSESRGEEPFRRVVIFPSSSKK
ncbi:MAG: R3H domain-containing nucleic acid-binding protein [bacterium]